MDDVGRAFIQRVLTRVAVLCVDHALSLVYDHSEDRLVLREADCGQPIPSVDSACFGMSEVLHRHVHITSCCCFLLCSYMPLKSFKINWMSVPSGIDALRLCCIFEHIVLCKVGTHRHLK